MPDLSTNYLGLELKNPLIAASSGITKTLTSLRRLEDNGIGGIVLKSLFEESLSKGHHSAGPENYSPELYEHFGYEHDKYFTLSEYCELVSNARASLSVPVIASINCMTADWWFRFAEQIQSAGADAMELNVFNYASSRNFASPNIEKIYTDIIRGVKSCVSIPVSIKIGQNFSSIPNFVSDLERSGVNGVVMFNRFTDLDIDLTSLQFKPSFEFSERHEFFVPLKWIAILYNQVKCSLAASTGVKGFEEVAKLILAGASGVQLASLLYQGGPEIINKILSDLENWMSAHDIHSISGIKGQLAFPTDSEGIANYYMRSQFMEKIVEIE